MLRLLAIAGGAVWALFALGVLAYYGWLFTTLFAGQQGAGGAMPNDITDPAWFYSSLAQVSASIVGIIGAVFATRITDQMHSARAAFDLIQTDIIGAATHNLRGAARTFTDEELLARATVPQQDREILAAAAAQYQTLSGYIDVKRVSTLIKELDQFQSRAQSPWTQEQFATHLRWLNEVRHRVREFQIMVFPRSLWAVWALLAWLTVAGIILPMLALPGIHGSVVLSKALILVLFGAGALLFVLFLLRELIVLRCLGRRFEWR